MRYTGSILCAIVLLTSLPACFNTSPTRFANLDELNAYEKKEGFVMIDHFGGPWPGQIVKERQYHNEVNVIMANGETHVFDEYQGYKLRVITLKGKHGTELVVVYRSKEKE